jgi:hypothetical protein
MKKMKKMKKKKIKQKMILSYGKSQKKIQKNQKMEYYFI